MDYDVSYESWIRSVNKCDLHCHAARGAGIDYLSKIARCKIEEPKGFTSINEMNNWFSSTIGKLFPGRKGYELLIRSTINEAINDGVTYLVLEFATDRIPLYNNSVEYFVESLRSIVNDYNNIIIIPEVAIPKTINYKKNIAFAREAIDYNWFKSIDIIGEELEVEFESFVELYRYAKKAGLRLRAHVGEFGSAYSIEKTCELLELDEVQHGINAISSKDVMHYLRNNQIQLNICPTSNIKMGLVSDYCTHPIRQLFDEGIIVTINTDDRAVFNQSVSEEYIALYNNGCFSIEELEIIRTDTLRRSELLWGSIEHIQ